MPLTSAKDTHEHFRVLRGWLRSYKPAELWNEDGSLKPEVTEFMPQGDLRLGANPNANGGLIREDLELPDIHDYEIPVAEKGHGYGTTEASRVFGNYTADVLKLNLTKFRVFGPDETASNRLQAAYKLTDKQWDAGFNADPENDSYLSTTGGVIEQLSEHQCEGLLEGFLLTGRHGVWSSYESFIHVVDSMINQHAKWLEATVRHIPWRKPIASLNILLSSHVWRQDHNGFSHQDPGFVDLLLNKNFHNDHVVQIYYPADANMLLCVGEEAYKSTNKINAIFAGKQPAPTFQSIDEARLELQKGAATWDWAGNVKDGEQPDIVLACCGDVPTLEMLAASDALQDLGIKVRFVNVVKLLSIQDHEENDASLTDEEFTKLFGEDVTNETDRAGRLGSRLNMIFQDPYASLNPRWRVADILAEPLRVQHAELGEAEIRRRVEEALELVRLPKEALKKYPHQFSGGQRQRISIARVLSGAPEFVICDEPTSALDVSVQAQVLNLMKEMQQRSAMTYLFISHSLAVVHHMSDRVGVMYLGRLVELADKAALFDNPLHPYTRMLLDAIPHIRGSRAARTPVAGEVPSPLAPPPGCAFHPRCPRACGRCRTEVPLLRAVKTASGLRFAACHLVE